MKLKAEIIKVEAKKLASGDKGGRMIIDFGPDEGQDINEVLAQLVVFQTQNIADLEINNI